MCKDVNAKALAIIQMLLENGVPKKNLGTVCEALFDMTYLEERELLIRMSCIAKNFDSVLKL